MAIMFRVIYLTAMRVCCLILPLSAHAFTDIVSNETEFSASINNYNLQAAGDHFIVLANDITLSNRLADISNTSLSASLTIEGEGFWIDGDLAHSVVIIDENSRVTINNLMIIQSQDANLAPISLLDSATLDFNRSIAFNNSTTNGAAGAIHVGSSSSTLNVIDSTFSGNTADTDGGAIYSAGITTVLSSTFVGNLAGNSGGAIWSSTSLAVRGSTFCDNVAVAEGGAIFSQDVSGSVMNIHFSTLDSNTALLGSNIHATSTLAPLNIESIILTGGTCVGSVDTISGVSIVPSNIAADTCNLSATSQARIVEPNPMLGPLQYNGGQTQTLALLPGSAAIDQVTTNAIDTSDQRGIPRPLDATSDIGAFEFIHPDQLEENDSFGTAAEIQVPQTIPALSIDDSQSNELDWYKFQLASGDTATITISFLHDWGDIDISLVDDSLEEIGFGESTTDNEVIKFRPRVSGTYYLQVFGFQNARNLYDLDIQILADEICFPIIIQNGNVAVICL